MRFGGGGQSRTEQSRADKSRIEQSRAEQSRAEQDRAPVSSAVKLAVTNAVKTAGRPSAATDRSEIV